MPKDWLQHRDFCDVAMKYALTAGDPLCSLAHRSTRGKSTVPAQVGCVAELPPRLCRSLGLSALSPVAEQPQKLCQAYGM